MTIVLSGADTFRSQEKLREIRERFIREVDLTSFAVSEIDGATQDLNAIRAAIFTPSFFTPKRMVILKNILHSTSDVQTGVGVVCTEGVPDSCVLVCWDGPKETKTKSSRRTKKTKEKEVTVPLAEILKSQKYVQEFPELTLPQAVGWLIERAQRMGVTLESVAAEKLVASLGVNTWQLVNELDKLIAYVRTGDTIRAIGSADVDNLVGTKLHEDIFGFVDSLSNGNEADALRQLTTHLELGVESGMLAGMLIRQVRLLSQARAVFTVHGPKADLTSALSVHPFVARKLSQQVGPFSHARLVKLHDALISLEMGLKTSRGTSEVLFTRFVTQAVAS